MDRPKKEDYEFIEEVETILGPLGTIERFDSGLYEQALNSYIDQLEKALDKACEMIVTTVQVDYDDFENSCPFNKKCQETMIPYCENKEDWKEWCMRDE